MTDPTPRDSAPVSYFGCLTGDCPHQTQAECDGAIRAHCAELERDNATLTPRLAEAEAQCLVLAKLAADTPQFSNPLDAWAAKKVRDLVLARAALTTGGTDGK